MHALCLNSFGIVVAILRQNRIIEAFLFSEANRMKAQLYSLLEQSLNALKAKGEIPADHTPQLHIERCKDVSHGDFASNVAMTLAKPCKKAPRAIAEAIVAHLPKDPLIRDVDIAGPGFINFHLNAYAALKVIPRILEETDRYGCSTFGQGQKVLIEFVSANPTGPLHVGHGRSAAFGASLANILRCAGFDVDCEYYVNDAGRQMNILAASVWLRYLAHCNIVFPFPSNAYHGEYVKTIAEELHTLHGEKFCFPWETIASDLPKDDIDGGDKEIYIDAIISKARALLGDEGFSLFHQSALHSVLDDIREDLHAFGVDYQNRFSEQSLADDGSIEKGIAVLKEKGLTYEKEGALWFKATDFGDEKDRVLLRANGEGTYFASDVAYHWNKYERGYDRVIDIFGADHHGYISRVKAAVTALGYDDTALEVLLVQFAILYRGSERVQMSTRSGSFVTLRELREEVGTDAARFFYVMRKPEQHMDFDLELAKSQSNDNPVYYIQYAHARICSVLRQLEERGFHWNKAQGLEALSELQTEHEQPLITLLNRYPETIQLAAQNHEPHLLAYFMRELANGLHSYYNAVVLLCENESTRNARLSLLVAVKQCLKNGLTLMGVGAPESM